MRMHRSNRDSRPRGHARRRRRGPGGGQDPRHRPAGPTVRRGGVLRRRAAARRRAAGGGDQQGRGAQGRAPTPNRIKLVPYDHKAQAADTATATNKLIFQDKVKYIIGNAVGATCNAAQTITEPNKVMFSFVCWGHNNLAPEKPYSFRSMLSQWELAEPFYRWVRRTTRKSSGWPPSRPTTPAARTPTPPW